MDPFIGEIRIFPYTFAPRDWTECNGQLLSISQNPALFSLLGTIYGGNGQTNFGLPNLQCRVPVHLGQGQGLTPRVLGEYGGLEQTTLLASQIAPHTHPATANTTLNQTTQASATLKGATDTGASPGPEGNNLATATANIYKSGPRNLKDMAATSIAMTQPAFNASTTVTVGNNGGGNPVPTMSPFLVLRFCISLQGIFPSRN
jgi:microcystin-dependent protein